jgi:Excalibur calcium-binding domain/Protein of unknown function (DUF1524)
MTRLDTWSLAVTGLMLASLTACGSTADAAAHKTSRPSPSSVVTASAQPSDPAHGDGPNGTAAAMLARLPVKGRAPMTGYSREMFGEPWSDTDGNGCDTRDDVLSRDLTDLGYEPGSDCVVLSGQLADPYTRAAIDFRRGDGDLVDVDHVVALGNAWVTGAFQWDDSRRSHFANDPANLLAVDASANRQKGDGDAATWLPSNKAYRCAYVERQVAVKASYGLWVTPPERAAMLRVLAGCPDQSLPRDAVPPTGSASAQAPASATPSGGHSAGGAVYYANCDAARAAEAAPVHRGDAGYSRRLDRDGDGTGCE